MKSERVEIKNLCPLIAMISAGKTSIINVLFNTDIFESCPGIGTKFVNIIRYNEEVGDIPKFYHLKVNYIGNGNYDYFKEKNTEIKGKEKIKEKIKYLNDEFKRKDIPYNELFYMIEIGGSNYIDDKEYLKNYDFVDIPGLNEYNKNSNSDKSYYQNKFLNMEDEMKNYHPEKEKNYLTAIFEIIKNKMNNGIIIFNIDNYHLSENYRIIGKLQKVLGKPIENFLILLNKIDKSENIQGDLLHLRSKIMEFFPSAKQFNFIKNIIIPCCSFQLENELKMDKYFKNLIYFHYLNFVINSKNSELGLKYINFIDFIKSIISRKRINKKYFITKIMELVNFYNITDVLEEIKDIFDFIQLQNKEENLILGIRKDDFNKEEILNLIEQINEDFQAEEEEENEIENITFDISNQENNMIILFYYSEFKSKKQIPPKSRNTFEIINYFSLKKNKFNFDINKIANYLFNVQLNDYIYIPLFGLSNAGKSTILNCIIG